LAPATIAFAAVSNKIIEALGSEAANPNALHFMNARDDAQLKQLSETLKPLLIAKCDALDKLIEENKQVEVRVSEKTSRFWEMKRVAISLILDVLEDGEKSAEELDAEAKNKREEYFKAARASWAGLKDVVTDISKDIIGPYVLGKYGHVSPYVISVLTVEIGDQLSIADLHLAAWLARIIMLSGGQASDDGNTIVSKLEAHIGDSFSLPKDFSVAEARRRAGLPANNIPASERQARLAAFWDAIKERPSWKKVYVDGLH
jgi:glutathione S-transferase